MHGLSKYYKKYYRDFKRFFLKCFMEYSKNKTIQKIVPKGRVWFMLLCLHLTQHFHAYNASENVVLVVNILFIEKNQSSLVRKKWHTC